MGRFKPTLGTSRNPYLKINTKIKASGYSTVVCDFFVKVLETVKWRKNAAEGYLALYGT